MLIQFLLPPYNLYNHHLSMQKPSSANQSTSNNLSLNQVLPMLPETNNFIELITKYQHLYIDKTSFISQILEKHDKQPILVITRPSGWGKSTNLTMLKNFLQIKVDSQGKIIHPLVNFPLFAGGKMLVDEQILQKKNACISQNMQNQEIKLMAMRGLDQNSKRGRIKILDVIRKKQKQKNVVKVKKQYILKPLKISQYTEGKMTICHRDQFGCHPVIYADFGNITKTNIDGIKYQIFTIIHSAYMKHSYLQKTPLQGQFNLQLKHIQQIIKAPQKIHWSPLDNLFMNIRETLQQYFGKSCYILVDNYDFPVLKLLKSENMSDIRHMASIIASLFTDFAIKSYIPPSEGVKSDYRKMGKKITSTRAILMGKTNIFSTYLTSYVHHSLSDPNLYSQFGLNFQQISQVLLPKVLHSLRDFQQYTHFQLNSPSGFVKIKKQLSEQIRVWYGGYIQQLGTHDSCQFDKYAFSSIWYFLKEYITNGIVNQGNSYWIQNQQKDRGINEMWFLRRILKSFSLSKIFQFQIKKPPCIKMSISQFLSPDCRSSNQLTNTELLYLSYSLGYITGSFLPICPSEIYITKPHFPNRDIQNKFKSIIIKNLQPYFNPPEQLFNRYENKIFKQESFDINDVQNFKNTFQNIINRIVKKQTLGQNLLIEQGSLIFYMGVIFFRVLYDKSGKYVAGCDFQPNSQLIIDNIYVKKSQIGQNNSNISNRKSFDLSILIDIRHCKTSDQAQMDSLYMSAIRDAYEDKSNLKRLVGLAQNCKNMNMSQTYTKFRIGVMCNMQKQCKHQLFLLPDITHSYAEIVRIMNFFQNRKSRSKWKKAHHFMKNKQNQQIIGYTFTFQDILDNIKDIGRGRGDQVYQKMKNIIKIVKRSINGNSQIVMKFDATRINQDSELSEQQLTNNLHDNMSNSSILSKTNYKDKATQNNIPKQVSLELSQKQLKLNAIKQKIEARPNIVQKIPRPPPPFGPIINKTWIKAYQSVKKSVGNKCIPKNNNSYFDSRERLKFAQFIDPECQQKSRRRKNISHNNSQEMKINRKEENYAKRYEAALSQAKQSDKTVFQKEAEHLPYQIKGSGYSFDPQIYKNYISNCNIANKTRAQLELQGSFLTRNKSGAPSKRFRYQP